jgi:acylphosphatase
MASSLPLESAGGFYFPPAFSPVCGIVAWVIVMSRSQMRILYSGRVQGVGFRATVKSVACGFDLTGTVSNLADGRVEMTAEGSREELEAFRQAIRDSGLARLIAGEQVSWADAGNTFRGFEIVS